MTLTPESLPIAELKKRAHALSLHGLLAHWDEQSEPDWPWITRLLQWEETARNHRGLQRRLANARLGHFKPLADFDWQWPVQCDKGAISELMRLDFIRHAINVILVGSNGVGKTTIAQNLVHQAVLQGYPALFIDAAQLLGDLSAADGDNALRRRIKHYALPPLLVIDELGYLSYGNRHADLLFEIVNRRYEKKSTIITTNRPFSEWGEVFPNASCVVSLVDRLVHHSEIIVLEGESYRMKEAKERAGQKKTARSRHAKTTKKATD